MTIRNADSRPLVDGIRLERPTGFGLDVSGPARIGNDLIDGPHNSNLIRN